MATGAALSVYDQDQQWVDHRISDANAPVGRSASAHRRRCLFQAATILVYEVGTSLRQPTRGTVRLRIPAPWELDLEQPRMQGSVSALLRHYFGLRGTESKFRRMLLDFEVQPLNSLIEELKFDASATRRERIPEVALGELGAYLGEGS